MVERVIIRKAVIEDLPAIQEIFVNSIKFICRNDYNDIQLEAWLNGVHDLKRWLDLIYLDYVLVATNMKDVLGFCSLKNQNHIDMLFIHFLNQRKGIAKMLLSELIDLSKILNQDYITSNVSITALPFFQSMGFEVIQDQFVERRGVLLKNYRMVLSLS